MKSIAHAMMLIMLLVLFGCSSSSKDGHPLEDRKPLRVADIIQNLGTYHGQSVTVHGFVRMTFEGTAVFEKAEDAMVYGPGSGAVLWLDVAPPIRDARWMHTEGQKYHQKECLLDGVINTNSHGHFGMYPATLEATGQISIVHPEDQLLPAPGRIRASPQEPR